MEEEDGRAAYAQAGADERGSMPAPSPHFE